MLPQAVGASVRGSWKRGGEGIANHCCVQVLQGGEPGNNFLKSGAILQAPSTRVSNAPSSLRQLHTRRNFFKKCVLLLRKPVSDNVITGGRNYKGS
jgi:hypothetical protein